MNITEVRIRRTYTDRGILLARASITTDNDYVTHDIKVLQGPNRRFVGMPGRTDDEYKQIFGEVPPGNSQYRTHDIAHPTTPEARKHLEEMVLAAYDAHMALPEPERLKIEEAYNTNHGSRKR